MYKVRLDLCYLGTRYEGWQSQVRPTTIQYEVERSLSIVLRKPIKVLNASRTDSGVHAQSQVCTFVDETLPDLERLSLALNGVLPADIRVKKATQVPLDFHPRHDAITKVYRYSLWLETYANPFLSAQTWHIRHALDIEQMERGAAELVGTHDFTSFCAGDSSVENKVRTISRIEFEREGELLHLWFYGNGFLKQMIRIIVGTLVKRAKVKFKDQKKLTVGEILGKKDRRAAGPTAPAQGLTLMDIVYARDSHGEMETSFSGLADDARA